MASQTVSNFYSSNATVSIPSTAFDVRVTVQSPGGGAGGAVPPTSLYSGGTGSTIPGGAPGGGRQGVFVYRNNFVARTLTIRIGQAGGNGSTYLQNYFENGFNFPLNCDGRSSNIGSGGCGGASNHQVFIGGGGLRIISQESEGGAGGGATGIIESGNAVIVAGGGGGGSGGSYHTRRNTGGGEGTWANAGRPGGDAGNWSAVSGVVSFSNGGNGQPSGGGAGGGSLAGSPGIAQYPGADTAGSGGGSSYNNNQVQLVSSSINSSTSSYVIISYKTLVPEINSFTATPNPQTSGTTGTPSYTTVLSWSAKDFTSLVLTSSIGESWNVTGNSRTITNLPQSTGSSTCSNVGASRSYTLTACAGSTCVSRNVSVTVFNDNSPIDNITIADRTGLNPNTAYIINLGSISGIDMATNVVGGPGVTVSKNNLGSFASSTTITCNNTVQVRFFSDAFNTDPNGLPTALKTLYVDIGTLRKTFRVSTRPPIVREEFNFENENNKVPFPDIDTILTAPDHPAQQFISSKTITIDDVELQNPDGVEIRTNNGNAQVRKKLSGGDWGPWRDVRSI
jgi:hypothetical protein